MKFVPQDESLRKHIDYYWIITDARTTFGDQKIYGYPGITPELFIPLDGHWSYQYLEQAFKLNQNTLFSYIDDKVILDPTQLNACILVVFKPRCLSSVMPFVTQQSKDLMSHPICDAAPVFGQKINSLSQHLKKLAPTEMVDELDDFFLTLYQPQREGFVAELAGDYQNCSTLKDMMQATRYSYSTIERYFKKETGLSPKFYQSLKKAKLAIKEIYWSQNPDWLYYVEKYGYFDQSHFIKSIKRFSTFTPAQLLEVSGLPNYRPF